MLDKIKSPLEIADLLPLECEQVVRCMLPNN